MLSVCVSFAPFLQWWFAINGLVEMLIYGACFVLGSNYLVSRAFNPRKIAVAVGMAVCAVGYVLTFYPTWMVPVAWGFVPLFCGLSFGKFDRKVLRRVECGAMASYFRDYSSRSYSTCCHLMGCD